MSDYILKKISIPIPVLNCLSDIEIGFFSALGVTLNDIMMNWKLTVIFGNRVENLYEDVFGEQQLVSLIISQVGRLFECKKLINSFFSNSEMKTEYYDSLSTDAEENLKMFKRIDASKFKIIRNKLSNHYDLNEMTNIAYDNIKYLKSYELYFVSDFTNMRLLGPDFLRQMGLLNIWGCTNIDDFEEVDETMHEIVLEISHYTSYLQKFSTTIFDKMISKLESEKVNLEEINLDKPAFLGDIRIPFFVTNQKTPDN